MSDKILTLVQPLALGARQNSSLRKAFDISGLGDVVDVFEPLL